MKKLLSSLVIATTIITSAPVAMADTATNKTHSSNTAAYIAPLNIDHPITLHIQLDGHNQYDQDPLKVDGRVIVVEKVRNLEKIDDMAYHQLKLLKGDIKTLKPLSSTTAITNAQGHAQVENLTPGIYKVSEQTESTTLRLSDDLFILPVKTADGNFSYDVTVHPKSIVTKKKPPKTPGSSDIPAWALLIPLIPLGIGLLPQVMTFSGNVAPPAPIPTQTHIAPPPNVVKQPPPVVKKRGPILLAHTGANVITLGLISMLMMVIGGMLLIIKKQKAQ